MKLQTIITIIAFVGGACLTGCVAQVGQGDDRTGTTRSSLGNDPDDNGGDPQGDPENTTGGKHASDPGNNSTSGDNQGPQPLPWTTTGTAGPSGGTEEKKK